MKSNKMSVLKQAQCHLGEHYESKEGMRKLLDMSHDSNFEVCLITKFFLISTNKCSNPFWNIRKIPAE